VVTPPRAFENDEYLPEYSTLVLRDALDGAARQAPQVTPAGGELLGEYATDALSAGTIARAGNGWLHGLAGDGYHRVRLEVHDHAPADDRSAWDDVVETPYRSATGSMGLTHVTSGWAKADLDLGAPGVYRARVSRRPADDGGDVWRVQFWPQPGVPEPPRWLDRHGPATASGRSGWEDVLGYEAAELTWAVRAAAAGEPEGVTVGRIEVWGAEHQRPAAWLDEPLWPAPPAPLPTGHADLDANARELRRSLLAEAAGRAEALGRVAAQLGAPAPTTRRGLLALLVAAGLLATDDSRGERRYRPVAEPQRAQDVLQLPPERVALLERQDASQRYSALASDLAAVVMWAVEAPAVVSVQGLAERLLATPEEVRASLRHAADVRLLEVDGDPAERTASLRVRLLPKRGLQSSYRPEPQRAPVPGPPWNRPAAPAAAAAAAARPARPVPPGGRGEPGTVVFATPGGYRPPLGAPPRAGLVSAGGDVVVWRDGEPIVLARLPDRQPHRALETAYGIVVLSFGERRGAVVIRPDGRVDALGAELAPQLARSEDGRHLAVNESGGGRRRWSRLHLVDLADGSRQTMPGRDDECHHVVALHGGVVYFQAGHALTGTVGWSPGADPELLQHHVDQIDPLSGTRLAHDDQPGVLVVGPDGTARRVMIDPRVGLAPGGERLYAYRHSPPAVTLFEVATGAADPRVFWLPPGSQTSTTVPGHPVWEDAHHLLVSLEHHRPDVGAPAVRLDVRTGEFEGVPLTEAAGYRPLLIEPLLRPAG
jgi:Family of unknown function (DUF6042)